MNKKTLLTILIFFLSCLVGFGVQHSRKFLPLANVANAYEKEEDEEDEHEDHEDEHEDEEDDDDYKKSSSSNNTQEEVTYETVEVPVTTQQKQTYLDEEVPAEETVVRYITTIDPGYNIDTDGDKLVDALDPNPTIPESEFFTDDDNDGIPNAQDQYKGEDDFLYIEFADTNNNGILDDFENL